MKSAQAIAVVFLAATAGFPTWAETDLQLGDPAPQIAADSIQGQIPSIGEGRTTIVEFWATWCGPCRKTIPHMTKVQQYFGPKGVDIVGISVEDEATVRPFVEQMGDQMAYTVAIDQNMATADAYMNGFGVSTIPHAFIVDKNGKIVWHGHPGSQEMIDVLNKLSGPEEHTVRDGELRDEPDATQPTAIATAGR